VELYRVLLAHGFGEVQTAVHVFRASGGFELARDRLGVEFISRQLELHLDRVSQAREVSLFNWVGVMTRGVELAQAKVLGEGKSRKVLEEALKGLGYERLKERQDLIDGMVRDGLARALERNVSLA